MRALVQTDKRWTTHCGNGSFNCRSTNNHERPLAVPLVLTPLALLEPFFGAFFVLEAVARALAAADALRERVLATARALTAAAGVVEGIAVPVWVFAFDEDRVVLVVGGITFSAVLRTRFFGRAGSSSIDNRRRKLPSDPILPNPADDRLRFKLRAKDPLGVPEKGVRGESPPKTRCDREAFDAVSGVWGARVAEMDDEAGKVEGAGAAVELHSVRGSVSSTEPAARFGSSEEGLVGALEVEAPFEKATAGSRRRALPLGVGKVRSTGTGKGPLPPAGVVGSY